MQTLKEIFMREDEKLNLRNGAITIFIVISFVIVAMTISEMRFDAPDTASQENVPTTTQQSANNE